MKPTKLYGVFYHQNNRKQWSGPYLGDLLTENEIPIMLGGYRKQLKKKVKLMEMTFKNSNKSLTLLNK